MEQVKLRTKLLFGAGDMYGGGAINLINFLYLIYLTDVVGIRPVYAGGIFLFSKIWDAISDPMMGAITDNTRSRLGRRRPYFLAGIFFIVISFVILWFPVNFASEIAKVLYVLVSALFFFSVYTMVFVPYCAMFAELTTDYNERSKMSAIRLAFSMCATIVCALVPLVIINSFDNIRIGYLVMALVFGVFFTLPYIGIFASIKEKTFVKTEKFSLKSIIAPLKIKSFRYVILTYLAAFFTLDCTTILVGYYMKYYMQRTDHTNTVLGAVMIAQVHFLPVYFFLSKKFGKSITYCIGAVVAVLGFTAMALVPPDWPVFFMYLAPIIMGAGVSATISMPWAMFADVNDVGQLISGEQNSGSFSGAMTFVRKFSSAFGVFLVSALLDFTGYIGPIDGIEQAQPAQVILTIRIIIFTIPLLLFTMGFISAKKYPLTKQVHARLRSLLDSRKEGKSLPEEEKELKAILV